MENYNPSNPSQYPYDHRPYEYVYPPNPYPNPNPSTNAAPYPPNSYNPYPNNPYPNPAYPPQTRPYSPHSGELQNGYPPNPGPSPYPPHEPFSAPPRGTLQSQGSFPYPQSQHSQNHPNSPYSGELHGYPPSVPNPYSSYGTFSAPPRETLQHQGSFPYSPPRGTLQSQGSFEYPPPPRGTLQHQGSFHYEQSHNHYQQPPISNAPSRLNSFPAMNENFPSYPHLYPSIEDQLSNVHLSAPASPPAPPVSHNLYSSSSGKYGAYPNSSFNSSFNASHSGPLGASAYPPLGHSNSYNDSSQNNLQISTVPTQGSLKVLLLHGNLDIWINGAKNLPNMDMFHKTLRDMFSKIPGGSAVNKITSDPYVSISVARAVIGRTYVISNDENPVWKQRFYVAVAHRAPEVHFLVKDNDVVGSQLIGVVAIPVEKLYSGEIIQGDYPILNTSGKVCKAGAVLNLSIQYIPIDRLSSYHQGVEGGPDYFGVAGTYFPLRRGGTVHLYQDAHVPDNFLPNLKLDNGAQYVHGQCWRDIFDGIRQARRLIYITGWSVWHNVKLVRDVKESDITLGNLLRSKSQEGVRVLLLIWDDPTSRSIIGYKTDGVMQTHDEETRRFFKKSSVQVLLCPRAAGKKHSWMSQREVETIYTHHQKTVIVDADAGNNRRRIVAFVGGLDLCDGRYDNPQHSLYRTLQTVHKDDYHNPTYTGSVVGCPREPWHDLHSKIDGPAAYDVLSNFEERWWKASKPSGIKKLSTNYDDALLRIDRMPDIVGVSEAPFLNENDPESWHAQIFRSIDSNSVKAFPKDPKEAISKNLMCGKNVVIDMSIHTAYVKAIRAAQHYIYIENQYFIGSSYNWNSHKDLGANNLIPMEIALKIADKIRAHERFAVYIIIPMWPEGNPTGTATQRILFWQHKTMQMMYETIYKALVEVGLESSYTPSDYLNFFCLGNREASDGVGVPMDGSAPANTPQALSRKHRRFMIYVHSKGMIVDDEYVILGSANINQRSLEGTRDTEIAMGAYQPHYTWARKRAYPRGQIYGYRMSLWAEHMGFADDCFTQPESLECVKKVRLTAETNWAQFAAEPVSELKGHLLKYPVEVDRTGKVRALPGCESFPDVGGNIIGSFIAIQENLTI